MTARHWFPARIVRNEPHEPRPPRLSLVLIVDDPDAGEVPVRWRCTDHPDAWVWRCTSCDIRTTTTDCAHTFAAALQLATTLLGLKAVGVASPTPEGAST